MIFSLKNTISLLIVKGSTIGLRLFTMLLLAKFLTPAAFSTIAFIFTAAEVLRLIIDLGLDTYLLRQHSLSQRSTPLSTVFISKLLAMVCFGALLYTLSDWLNPALTPVDWLLIFGFGSTPLLQNISAVFLQAKNNLLALLPLYSIITLSACAVVFWIIYCQVHINVLFVLLLVEVTIGVLGLFLVRKNWGYLRQFHIKDALINYQNSFAIGFAIIIGVSYAKLDIFMLTKMTASVDVGIYALSMRVLDPLMFVAGAYFSDVYAKMSAMPITAANHSTQIKFLNKSFLMTSLMTLVYVSIACIALNLFAKQYTDAYLLVVLVGLSVIFKMRNLSYSAFINANGKYSIMSRVAVINFFMVLGFLYAGIYYFGIWGAAVAIATAEAFNSVMQYLIVRNIQKQIT